MLRRLVSINQACRKLNADGLSHQASDLRSHRAFNDWPNLNWGTVLKNDGDGERTRGMLEERRNGDGWENKAMMSSGCSAEESYTSPLTIDSPCGGSLASDGLPQAILAVLVRPLEGARLNPARVI